jgi:hypothetical protein
LLRGSLGHNNIKGLHETGGFEAWITSKKSLQTAIFLVIEGGGWNWELGNAISLAFTAELSQIHF